MFQTSSRRNAVMPAIDWVRVLRAEPPSRGGGVDISFAQTQKMEALLKAEATVLPAQSASNAGIDCSTSFSMWVINEGRGWDVMINSIWGFLRLPAG